MDEEMVRQVRRFNRLVTQRVGALDDHFLARDRPLGEARLLWEIGEEGADVRRLRSRLDLDSGHLSRLLRALEADGLVTTGPREDDRRVRIARLTPSGSKERAVLDGLSQDQARSLLDPLTESQRRRLVDAMGTVERLLTAALVGIGAVDPSHHHVRHCLDEFLAELDRRLDTGFDPARARAVDLDGLRPPAGAFLVASLRGEPIGGGGLRFHRSSGTAEIKRLWVAVSARGLGVGRRLLAALETEAAAQGCRVVQLDTNEALVEAIALYRSAGYREVAPFNDEIYAHHWFEKDLGAAS